MSKVLLKGLTNNSPLEYRGGTKVNLKREN